MKRPQLAKMLRPTKAKPGLKTTIIKDSSNKKEVIEEALREEIVEGSKETIL